METIKEIGLLMLQGILLIIGIFVLLFLFMFMMTHGFQFIYDLVIYIFGEPKY